jgi:hypothetical protein
LEFDISPLNHILNIPHNVNFFLDGSITGGLRMPEV